MSDTRHIDPIEIADVFEEADQPGHDGDREIRLIGTVDIHDGGRLEVATVEPAREAFLRGVVDRMNRKSGIVLRSTVPPDEPYSTDHVSVERGDPGFGTALRTYMRTYYGLRLN